jgi:hypothetical protein
MHACTFLLGGYSFDHSVCGHDYSVCKHESNVVDILRRNNRSRHLLFEEDGAAALSNSRHFYRVRLSFWFVEYANRPLLFVNVRFLLFVLLRFGCIGRLRKQQVISPCKICNRFVDTVTEIPRLVRNGTEYVTADYIDATTREVDCRRGHLHAKQK